MVQVGKLQTISHQSLMGAYHTFQRPRTTCASTAVMSPVSPQIPGRGSGKMSLEVSFRMKSLFGRREMPILSGFGMPLSCGEEDC